MADRFISATHQHHFVTVGFFRDSQCMMQHYMAPALSPEVRMSDNIFNQGIRTCASRQIAKDGKCAARNQLVSYKATKQMAALVV